MIVYRKLLTVVNSIAAIINEFKVDKLRRNERPTRFVFAILFIYRAISIIAVKQFIVNSASTKINPETFKLSAVFIP